MKYFICSDIHGYFDEWITALNNAGFELKNQQHKIILCGDAFDRGKQAVQVYKYLKELKQSDKLIYIRGNHEDLLFECVKQLKVTCGCAYTYHYSNGTVDTIQQLKQEDLLAEVLEFIQDNSINYFETANHIFVHGWIPLDLCGFYHANWRDSSQEAWNKTRWTNPVEMYRKKIFDPDKTIVCGHWHCSALWHEYNPIKYDEFGNKANFEPFITDKLVAIDGCTAVSHKVNVIVIDE